MEELFKVILWVKDPGKFSQVKKACNRSVIYVLRVIYKKFKRIVLLSYIKDLSSFFTLQKKFYESFIIVTLLIFKTFPKQLAVAKLCGYVLLYLEFEM